MGNKTIALVSFIVSVTLVFLLGALIVQLGWNGSLAEMFPSVPKMGYVQAMYFTLLLGAVGGAARSGK